MLSREAWAHSETLTNGLRHNIINRVELKLGQELLQKEVDLPVVIRGPFGGRIQTALPQVISGQLSIGRHSAIFVGSIRPKKMLSFFQFSISRTVPFCRREYHLTSD